MATSELAPASKKAKTSILSVGSTSATAAQELALVPVAQSQSTQKGETDSLIPREFERLSLTINPDYISKLEISRIAGYERPITARLPTMRYYEIHIENLRNVLTSLLADYLTVKLREKNVLSYAQVAAEVETITPVIVNACFAALYAKLRTIHKHYVTYAGRFPQTPTYSKDVELPLPLADAIQNFGVFTPVGIQQYYFCTPVYPEGVQNEGRSTQNWSSYQYEAYLPYLKSLGIPVKSVDTRLKFGSSWWSYKVTLIENHFDFRCIYPPVNYSDHTALLASMFMQQDSAGNTANWIVMHLTTDVDYPVRLRQIPNGFQFRAFSALCHAPREEWNPYLLLN